MNHGLLMQLVAGCFCVATLQAGDSERFEISEIKQSRGEFSFEWTGGHAPFTVQSSTDGASWIDVESEISIESFAARIAKETRLYRVVSSVGHTSEPVTVPPEISGIAADPDAKGDRRAQTNPSDGEGQPWQRDTRDLGDDAPADLGTLATVDVGGAMNLVAFEVGVPVWSDSDRYVWKDVPKGLEGFLFTQFDNHYKGFTEFQVESSGRVFLAVTSRWGGGGNGGGGWTNEVTTKDEFFAQGWKAVTDLHETADDYGHKHEWVLYTRKCTAGEKYRLRTEKYCTPLLFFRS